MKNNVTKPYWPFQPLLETWTHCKLREPAGLTDVTQTMFEIQNNQKHTSISRVYVWSVPSPIE